MTKEIKQLYIFILARKGLVNQYFSTGHLKRHNSKINILLGYDIPISFVVDNECIKYYRKDEY